MAGPVLPKLTAAERSARARIAAQARHHPEAERTSARDFRAARLADHIRVVVDEAPALDEIQRAELAALLYGVEPAWPAAS